MGASSTIFQVDHVLDVVQRAALLCRTTPGRHGTTLKLSDANADEVLVAGDLHGNRINLHEILDFADLANHPRRHLVLQEFVHGSGRYPNNGCDSHQLLDIVCALKCKFPNQVHLLIGNHELAEWTNRAILKQGNHYNELFAAGLKYAFRERADEVRAAYLELFASMLVAIRTPNGVFISHTIPTARMIEKFDLGLFEAPVIQADQLEPNTSLYHLLWGRDVSEETSKRFAAKVGAQFLITGHIAQPEKGFHLPNSRQIIVDCMSRPASCVLFPVHESITFEDLVDSIAVLGPEEDD